MIKLLNRNWLTSQWLHKYLLQLILRNKITQSFFSFLMPLQNVSEKNIKINCCIIIYSVPSSQVHVYPSLIRTLVIPKNAMDLPNSCWFLVHTRKSNVPVSFMNHILLLENLRTLETLRFCSGPEGKGLGVRTASCYPCDTDSCSS